MYYTRLPALLALVTVAACSAAPGGEAHDEATGTTSSAINTEGYNELNLAAGSMVLYEAQVRTANACHPDAGSSEQRAACNAKVAPTTPYRAKGMTCGVIDELTRIKLGTLDDMMEDTADYRTGITLRYVREKVRANTVWLMPLFPNNDTWNIPDACDNLGSPYAVRDYMHAAGRLSRACIAAGRDEYSDEPCWGNAELDALIAQAHSRGLKVMLDVALNHFGHNYSMYDYAEFRGVRARTDAGEDLNRLWDFARTEDPALIHPRLLDRSADLGREANALRARCPNLRGDKLVRAYNAWREAFDWERAQMSCDEPSLEFAAPGFYLGANRWDPATRLGDNFTNNWRDVKFLYHREENTAHTWEFARNREYLFRILNYWVSRGVDGFRLDHTTDADNGFGSNEWKYILSKVDYYAWRRGQARPVYLAEEFHDQMEMNKVVDIMTEGYVGDMNGRGGKIKDTHHVERVLNNMDRFGGRVFTMTALETHDEHRLVEDTGFNMWTGAGFWGIGATTRSTPMILMGQELGESWGIGFRRSDFLRARFSGRDQDALVGYYRAMNKARLAPENRALLAPNHAYLRSRWTGEADARIFAQVKWSDDANVVFTFHNLWEQPVAQSFYIPSDVASALRISDGERYRLYDVLADRQMGSCKTGADLKWDLYVAMDAGTRAQWLRLELCR